MLLPEGSMDIDITRPKVFTIAAIFCILAGGVLGVLCAYLFYTVTHIKIATGGTIATEQIDPMWGAVFILIMAATAFCIALTFRLVPGWVVQYYETREVPPVMKWIHSLMQRIDNLLGEDGENKE
jgi:hypothetical protein